MERYLLPGFVFLEWLLVLIFKKFELFRKTEPKVFLVENYLEKLGIGKP